MGRFKLVIAVVALLALGVALAFMPGDGFSARAEPTLAETLLARTVRRLATPSRAKRAINPQPASRENLHQGLEHFADHCATCHGNDGSGDTLLGRGMYPHPPDLRKADTQKLTDGELFYIIENGIRLTGMPAFAGSEGHDAASTWNLVLFIRHLPSLTAAEKAEMQRLNPKTPDEWIELSNNAVPEAGQDHQLPPEDAHTHSEPHHHHHHH